MSRHVVAGSLVIVALVGAFALGRATAPEQGDSKAPQTVPKSAPTSNVPNADKAEPTALDEVLVPASRSNSGQLLVLAFSQLDECYPHDVVTDVNVVESPDLIALTAKSVPGSSVPQEDCDDFSPSYRIVNLREPLGDRDILDGSCGLIGRRCVLIASTPGTGDRRARSYSLAPKDVSPHGPYRDAE